MNGDVAASGLYLLLGLVLVGSALAAYRLPLGRTLKMMLAWGAIFGLGYVALSFRHDLGDLFASRLAGRAIVEGGTVRVPMADDGHFWVDARINGADVRLMIDSGATVTTLSRSAAAKAGLDASAGLPALVGTANGMLEVRRARAASLAIGDIVMRDVGVHVAPSDDFNVIGMNVLSRLSRSTVEGRWMILTP